MKNFTQILKRKFGHLFFLFFSFLSITSAQSNWSEPTTWANLGLPEPAENADVTIPMGAHIILDVNSPNLGILTIHGTLSFANADLDLIANQILVMGTFQIGSAANPFSHQATITLNGTNTDGSGDRGIMVMGGNLELHGNPPAIPWSKINAHASAGSTNLTMMENVGWNAGDEIAIAPTDYYFFTESQRTTISTISGTSINIADGLNSYRWGQLQYATNSGMSLTNSNLVTPPASAGNTPTVLDERAHVGNLTRNIVIQAPDDALWQNNCFGVHIMIMRMGTGDNKGVAHVNGIEIRRGGQATNVGRYPFHWHMLSYEDCADPGGNCQTLTDATGQYLRNSSINQSCFRGVVIHGTNGVEISNNVIYDVRGHGIMTEDAAERRNTVEGNLILRIRNSDSFPEALQHEIGSAQGSRGASGFWISNPDNTWRNNVAADCQTNGYWLAFSFNPWRLCRYVPMTPAGMTFGIFENNTAHSNRLEGIMLDRREIEQVPAQLPGDTRELQYFSTSNNQYPSAPWNTVQRYTISGINTWKNGSQGLWDRTAAIDMLEFVSADNCGRFFAGSGAEGVIARCLMVGTSLNHNLNGITRPNFTGEVPPAAFATYHSAFSIQDNVIVDFPEVAGEMSGAFATNDYYLRPVEKGHIRSTNNLLVNSHPGVKLEAPFDYFTLSSAFWDPNGVWGNANQYLVYDDPFLTYGQTPNIIAPGPISGGVAVDGPFFGFYRFVVNYDYTPAMFNARNEDLMAINVNRLDNNFNVVGNWFVEEAQQGWGLAHMRDFSAHPSSYYTLDFPDIDPVTDVGLSVENMLTTNETLVLAVEFDGNTPVGQVYTSTRYNYFEMGHTLANTYANKHLYQPVASRQAVIDSAGETYWQDTANDLVWIKIQGGVDQEWNPANFSATSDELLYWEIYLRVTDIQNPNLVLPVELLDFSATLESNNSVKLDWTTATEIDNDYFQIQRSINGKNWQDITQIKGAGNSETRINYSFIDEKPFSGKSYYRLKQVDFDGTVSYSKIEIIHIEKTHFVEVFPNPTKDFLQLKFNKIPYEATFEILDINGKIAVPQKIINLPNNEIDIVNLKSGLYFIRVITENGTEVLPFVKM